MTWSFDALGPVTTEVNSLGTFTDTYNGPTDRMATLADPNGQANAQDRIYLKCLSPL